jgi:hypothetical protein
LIRLVRGEPVTEYPVVDLAAQRPDRSHYIYRFHDGDGALLYIGSSGDLWRRFRSHLDEDHAWWPEVDWKRTAVIRIGAAQCDGLRCSLPEHAEMQAHEKLLIKDLRPPHNTRWNGYCWRGLHLLAEHAIIDKVTGHRRCYTCQRERQLAIYDPVKQKAYRDANIEKIRARQKRYDAARSERLKKQRSGNVTRGSAKPQATLTEEIVRECRIRWAAGEGQRELAVEYGVSTPTMHKAITGKTWRHVA